MEGYMYREQLMEKKKNKIAGLYPMCKIEMLGMYVILIVLANMIQIYGLPLLLIPLSLCIPLIFALSGQLKDYLFFYKDGQFSGLLPVCDTGVSDQRD